MVRFCKTSASPWRSYNAGLEPGRAGVWVVSPPFTSVQQNHQIWKGATGTFPVWWCGSGSGHLVSRMQRAACGGGRGGGNWTVWTDSICISSMELPGRYGYVTSYPRNRDVRVYCAFYVRTSCGAENAARHDPRPRRGVVQVRLGMHTVLYNCNVCNSVTPCRRRGIRLDRQAGCWHTE